MKFRATAVILIGVLVLTGSVIAQDRPERGQRMQMNTIQLFEKDKVAEFLGLKADQKTKVFAEIDAMTKVYDPYKKEAEALAKKMDLPADIVTGGMGAMMRGGDRTQMTAMREKMTAFNTENGKLMKKYEGEEGKLTTHIGNIEKLLDDTQKTKFNFQPRMGRQAGGAAQQPQFDTYIVKPTFKPVVRQGRR